MRSRNEELTAELAEARMAAQGRVYEAVAWQKEADKYYTKLEEVTRQRDVARDALAMPPSRIAAELTINYSAGDTSYWNIRAFAYAIAEAEMEESNE